MKEIREGLLVLIKKHIEGKQLTGPQIIKLLNDNKIQAPSKKMQRRFRTMFSPFFNKLTRLYELDRMFISIDQDRLDWEIARDEKKKLKMTKVLQDEQVKIIEQVTVNEYDEFYNSIEITENGENVFVTDNTEEDEIYIEDDDYEVEEERNSYDEEALKKELKKHNQCM